MAQKSSSEAVEAQFSVDFGREMRLAREVRLRAGSEALAAAVRDRRAYLGFTQESLASTDDALSLKTIRAIEAGHPRRFQAMTLIALDRMLRWPDGKARSIVEGRTVEGGDRRADILVEAEDGTLTAIELKRVSDHIAAQVRAYIDTNLILMSTRLHDLVDVASELSDADLAIVVDLARRLGPRQTDFD